MLTRKDIKGNYDSEIKLSAITMISYEYIFVELHANDVNTIFPIEQSL